MKRTLMLILIVILAVSMAACQGPENDTVKIKPLVVMVSDTGGLGDQGFNDLVWAGCEMAREEEDIDIRCLESQSVEDYAVNIETAIQDDAVVVVCAGSELTSATETMATKYPDAQFILVDGQSELENVTCISFAEQEASFLAGIAAANVSKSGKIGFIGGIKGPNKEKYQYGFTAGVKTVNPEAQVLAEYTGSYTGEGEAVAAAKKQREAGVDVIFQSAGKGGLGVIDLAGEEKFWVIGSERDQSGLDSKQVLCSVVKRADKAVYEEIGKALKGKLKGETVTYNLDNEGLALSDNAGNLPPAVKENIQGWQDAIAKGDVVVPYDGKTAADFVPPEL